MNRTIGSDWRIANRGLRAMGRFVRRSPPAGSYLAAAACTFLAFGSSGCSRQLAIAQGKYINTAMHHTRPADQQTGDPLEVTIVSVYPHDLDNELNGALAPQQGITCDQWYAYRPEPGDKVDDEGHSRFRLPSGQVFVLTDEARTYGKKIGNALRGAAIDGKKTVMATFDFAGPLHDERSVLYVFPKFIGPDGKVLPVAPAKFDPPGAFTHELFVEIGVDKGRGNYGQYIDNKTTRKMHGKGEED